MCVIDIFSKYGWVITLKDKKAVSIGNAFQKVLKESLRKPNKIWVDKGSEFYDSSFKKWLIDNDIEMYSIHNERKSVVAESKIWVDKGSEFYDSSFKKWLIDNDIEMYSIHN